MKDGRTIRGGKATPKQTGIHVPLIAHWPGHFSPGVDDEIVDASDFLPTLLELAGSELPGDVKTDGISFAPRLLGKRGPRRTSAFFWYDPRPGWDKERFSRHVFAVNKNYKLFRSGRLFRLTDQPLEEIEVNPLEMTAADRAAQAAAWQSDFRGTGGKRRATTGQCLRRAGTGPAVPAERCQGNIRHYQQVVGHRKGDSVRGSRAAAIVDLQSVGRARR